MNDEKEKKKTILISIDIPYPKSCSECNLFDDHWDYPTCYVTQKSMGYNFDIFNKKMPNCPLKVINLDNKESAFK